MVSFFDRAARFAVTHAGGLLWRKSDCTYECGLSMENRISSMYVRGVSISPSILCGSSESNAEQSKLLELLLSRSLCTTMQLESIAMNSSGSRPEASTTPPRFRASGLSTRYLLGKASVPVPERVFSPFCFARRSLRSSSSRSFLAITRDSTFLSLDEFTRARRRVSDRGLINRATLELGKTRDPCSLEYRARIINSRF